MAENQILKILVLEDLSSDALLIIHTLKEEIGKAFELRLARDKVEFISNLDEFNPDLVLSDFKLPSFTGLEALNISKAKNPDTPVIIVTGSINEEIAVDCMKAGASDYILKDKLNKLVPAINGAFEKLELISSQRKTKQALIQNEKVLNKIFDSSPAIMMVINSGLRVEKLNKTALDFSGKKSADVYGKTIGRTLNCSLCSDDSECGFREHCKSCSLRNFIIKNLKEKERTISEEIEIEVGNEESFVRHIFLAYLERLTEKPDSTYLFTLIDITERKKIEDELINHREKLEELVKERTLEFENKAKQLQESQQALSFLLDDVNESREELLASNREIKKLSQALEQSPSSVIITNTEGTIEYINQQFSFISGYSFNEVKGKNPRFLNSNTHTKEFYSVLWQTIKSGQKWTGEICNRKKNGELFWEYTSISPLRNTKLEITNFIAVKEDITEKKHIEQKLKEYTAELELFNKLMVDRELKVIEMKEEVNSLCEKLGIDKKYPPVWNSMSEAI